MGDEQTVRNTAIFRLRCSRCGFTSVSSDPMITHCSAQFSGGVVCGGEFDDNGIAVDWWDLCDVLGIEPGMSVERLRADLAIAARVRECTIPDGPNFGHVQLPGEKQYRSTARALLGFLLGDNP